VKTKFQRRSGDPFTFLGNTIVTMATLAFTHDLTKAIGGAFGGDDSLIFYHKNAIIVDQSKHLAEIFNLSAKIENFPEAPMFSSKFLVYAEGYYRFIPDPIKVITRLGVDDLYCGEHVKEFARSFANTNQSYLNAEVRRKVAVMAEKRYARFRTKCTKLWQMSEFIGYLVANPRAIEELFSAEHKIWKRKLPKAMKDKLYKAARSMDYTITDMY